MDKLVYPCIRLTIAYEYRNFDLSGFFQSITHLHIDSYIRRTHGYK